MIRPIERVRRHRSRRHIGTYVGVPVVLLAVSAGTVSAGTVSAGTVSAGTVSASGMAVAGEHVANVHHTGGAGPQLNTTPGGPAPGVDTEDATATSGSWPSTAQTLPGAADRRTVIGEGPSRWRPPLAIPATVPRGFDLPAEPWMAGHRGIDLAGRPGALVRSVQAGVVAFAGQVAGVPVVSIHHADGLRSTYQPVVALVRAGDLVVMGEAIGTLAATGSHCAPACLHLGARRGESYLDPALLLRLRAPRLLPTTLNGR